MLWEAEQLSPAWGYTFLGSAHRQEAEDVDGDGWGDLPAYQRGVVRPRVFWNGPQGNSWLATGGFTVETRAGGTVGGAFLPDGAPFLDGLDTWRADAGTVARFHLQPDLLLSLRGSATQEWRTRVFRAAELFARYRLEPISFTAAYFYLHGTELDVVTGLRQEVPLNPRHAAGLSAVWEKREVTRVGLEAYYNGRQAVADDPYRSVTEPYVTIDALVQRRLGPLVVFLHGEDLNDVRQSHHDPLIRPTPTLGGRWTTDVWRRFPAG